MGRSGPRLVQRRRSDRVHRAPPGRTPRWQRLCGWTWWSPGNCPLGHVWTVLSIAARLCVCAALFLLPPSSHHPVKGRLLPEQRKCRQQQFGLFTAAISSSVTCRSVTCRSVTCRSATCRSATCRSVVTLVSRHLKGVPITKRSGSRSGGDFCVSDGSPCTPVCG